VLKAQPFFEKSFVEAPGQLPSMPVLNPAMASREETHIDGLLYV